MGMLLCSFVYVLPVATCMESKNRWSVSGTIRTRTLRKHVSYMISISTSIRPVYGYSTVSCSEQHIPRMKRWRQTEEKTASKRSRTDKNARATSFSVSQSLQDLLAKRGDFQDLTAADSYRYGLGYYRDQNLHAVFYFLLVTLQEQIVKFWQWLRQSAGVAHDRMCHAALATWKSIETENPGAQLEGAVAACFVVIVGSMEI